LQDKLEKKIKELQEMNECTKKLLSNKDNLIEKYEKAIEKINKSKNDLINQKKKKRIIRKNKN
jgi:hypothetical protein